jgi:hypothetical protein
LTSASPEAICGSISETRAPGIIFDHHPAPLFPGFFR